MGIVKAGPCSGLAGQPKDMKPDKVNRITKLVIGHDHAIDSIRFAYQLNNGSQDSKTWGGPGGQKTQIYLAPDVCITNMSDSYNDFRVAVILRSLKIETNHHYGDGAYRPFGKEEGRVFNLPAQDGKIVGFHGSSGIYLDAPGVYIRRG